MKLFLTSSTITPDLIKPFEEFIGKSSNGLKVVFIPDAGLKTGGDKSWIDEEMSELVNDLKWKVDKLTLGNENIESLEKLFNYDAVYVNGGYSGYLAEVMKKSGFDKRLLELFAKGIIYVGSSAGSMVLSKVQDAASFYFGEPEPEAIKIGGLGITDFEFYPMHDNRWTEDLVDKIKVRRDKRLDYYLVRDRQAISLENNNIKTYGEVVVLDKEV